MDDLTIRQIGAMVLHTCPSKISAKRMGGQLLKEEHWNIFSENGSVRATAIYEDAVVCLKISELGKTFRMPANNLYETAF